MTRLPSRLVVIVLSAAVVVAAGCEGYRNTVRGMTHSIGGIMPRDLQQADAYQRGLPDQLGLPPEQVKVEAGSGITHVTITGVTSDDDRQKLIASMQGLNKANPTWNPLEWTFE